MTCPVSRIIICPVGTAPNSTSTVGEAGSEFLLSRPAQDRNALQGEIHKFLRWLGLRRRVAEIGPLDIASYGEQSTPSEGKAIKSFLAYLYKRRLTNSNLSVHLRVKKSPRKTASPIQQAGKIQMTRQGYAKLEEELAKLRSQLPGITEELRRAAADKDFRENAPLAAARERKSHLQGKMQEIEATLKSATILSEGQGTSRIKIGDTVTLCDLSSGKRLRYVLVDTREANPAEGRISVASPIGGTLVDKEGGQTVQITVPAGTFEYRIEEVQHEMPQMSQYQEKEQ